MLAIEVYKGSGVVAALTVFVFHLRGVACSLILWEDFQTHTHMLFFFKFFVKICLTLSFYYFYYFNLSTLILLPKQGFVVTVCTFSTFSPPSGNVLWDSKLLIIWCLLHVCHKMQTECTGDSFLNFIRQFLFMCF